MTNLILGSMLVSSLSLALITIFSRLDTELSNKLYLKKLDIIIIFAVAVLYGVLYSRLDISFIDFINNSILIAYLVFMSYTDQKTKLLYTSVSIVMILIEAFFLVYNLTNIVYNEYTLSIILVILILGIMSIFRWIGFGDVLIYIVLSIYLTQYRVIPTLSIMINILLTNIMFVVVTIIVKLIKHDKDKHQPLTIFIAISTFICNLLMI